MCTLSIPQNETKICIDPAFFSIDIIQGFKGVNDTIDHVAGDGALHYYAALLSSVVKEASSSTEEMKGVVLPHWRRRAVGDLE